MSFIQNIGNYLNDMMSCIQKTKKLEEVVLNYSNGDSYKGQVLENKKEGKGWYFYHNGDIYYGEWSNNKKNRFGQFHYHSGQIYKGFWKNNKKFGYGEMYYSKQVYYKGQWQYNKKNGYGIYYDNGNLFKGQFVDNKKESVGYLIDIANNVYKVIHENGELKLKRNLNIKSYNFNDSNFEKKIKKYNFNEDQRDDIDIFESYIRNNINQSKVQKNSISQFNKQNNHTISSIFSTAKSQVYDSISLEDYKVQLDSFYNIVEEENIENWSVNDVLQYLEKIKLGEYIQQFKENQITGKSLIKIQERDLKQLGVKKKGDQILFMDSIKKLKYLNEQAIKNRYIKKKKLIPDEQFNSMGDKFLSLYVDKKDMIIEKSDEDSSCKSVSKKNKQPCLLIEKKNSKYQPFNSQAYEINSSDEEEIKQKRYSVMEFKLMKDDDKKKIKDDNQDNSMELDHSIEYNSLKLNKTKSKNNAFKKNNLEKFLIHPGDIQKGEFIADGGFGKVYKGLYKGGGKLAIKCYKKSGSHDQQFLELNFLKEVEILDSLRHPNIILYMGMSFDPKHKEWMMLAEYLENGSLYDHIHKNKKNKIPQNQIYNILKDIIAAMTYTHNKQIVHCDLKSSNILIGQSWNIKVADFGLSKKIIKLDQKEITRVGTPNWMAPETFRNNENIRASDVYSFGLIIWEILFKEIPFKNIRYEELEDRIGNSPQFVYNYLWNRKLDKKDQFLIEISKRCTKFNPEERPTFQQLQQIFDKKLDRFNKTIQLIQIN